VSEYHEDWGVFPPRFDPATDPWAYVAPRRPGRRRSIAILVSMALVVALVSAGYVQSLNTSGQAPTHLAGYTWCCTVREVSAQWVAPRLLDVPADASDALWVGVQNGYGTHPKLFLQVGIASSPLTLNPDGTYYAFWSDAAVGDRAQFLDTVAAGFVVRAQLQYVGSAWIVRIRLGSRLVTKVIHGLAGPSGSFAEWFEEDPLRSLKGPPHYLAMPTAAPTRMTSLLVNGRAPHPGQLSSNAFETGSGVAYYPTSPAADGDFSIVTCRCASPPDGPLAP
jgi:hypothetical protein